MSARNSGTGIGWVTRLLHWAMALGVIGMGVLGSYIARMEVSLSSIWLFGLHKSVGLLLLALLLVRIVWHVVSPPPAPLDDGIPWHGWLAAVVHRALYLVLVAVPVTGWVASAATGLDVVLFETWTLPRIAPVSEVWENAAFALHRGLTKLLFALVLLHIAGALRRHDGTVRRMFLGTCGERSERQERAQ